MHSIATSILTKYSRQAVQTHDTLRAWHHGEILRFGSHRYEPGSIILTSNQRLEKRYPTPYMSSQTCFTEKMNALFASCVIGFFDPFGPIGPTHSSFQSHSMTNR